MARRKSRRKDIDDLLGPLESAVMDVLWSRGSASVGEVLERLNAGRARPLAYTTVLTVLSRLVQKSLLERTERGRQHVYTPIVARSDFLQHEAERAVRAVIEDFGDMAIAGFLNAAGPHERHRQRMLDWLSNHGEPATDRTE